MLLSVNVTCSGQQGTEANACTLVLKLHYINPTSRNRLDQPFTKLNTRAIQKGTERKKDSDHLKTMFTYNILLFHNDFETQS